MKKTLALIGVAALLATVHVSAQNGAPTYADQILGTSVIAGSTATNVAYVIDCRKQASVTVGLLNQMSTSDTSAQVFNYSRSTDGINYTAGSLASFTPVASTQSYQITNLPTLGCGYIKINYVTNAAAGSVIGTNSLDYAIKISAP